jgi:alkylation response protein AidB-like acyl-CoA dehydrogenase
MTSFAMSSDALLTDDQRLLVEAARKWVERRYSFKQRMANLSEPQGYSQQAWQEMADMGWLGLGLPEAVGGYGGAAEAALIAEQLGQGLVVEPWLGTISLAAPILALAAEQGVNAASLELLSDVTTGTRRIALAAWERQGRHDASDVLTRAKAQPDGSYLLEGRKTLVLGGAHAQTLLVLARESGGQHDTAGLSLFLVADSTTGVHIKSLPTYDGRQVAEIVLDKVRLPSNARISGRAWDWVEASIDHATVMLCAECVGAMEHVIKQTLEYTQVRKQFGRSIASNQVVQHRLVDLWVIAQQMRAVTEAAVDSLAGPSKERKRRVSLAKAFLSSQGRFVGEDAVQLHGAIGMTDDYQVGQYYKRLAAAVNLFGDEAWHLERLDRLENHELDLP